MKKWVLIVFAAGLLLRLYGAGHGLAAGKTFHPDTPKQMLFLNFYMEGDYRIRFRMEGRDYHGYPAFHMHAAEWTYRGLRGFADMVGYPDWRLDGGGRWLFVRIITALFSSASVILVYLIGKELFSAKAGIFSAALFALHPFPVAMSHFIMGDTAMTFFALASFYMFALALTRRAARLYLAGGLLAGMSAACKYNGAFILLPGLFALFAKPGKKTVYGFLALVFGAVFGFMIGNPSMFTHFSEGLRGALAFSRHVGSLGWDSSQHRLAAAAGVFPAHVGVFAGLFGVLPAMVSLAALVWIAAGKRSVKTFFAAVFPVGYFVLSIIAQPYPRALYMLPAVPFFLMTAGWALAEGFEGGKLLRRGAAGMLFVLLVLGGFSSYRESFLFRAQDTRISAEEWAERNIPGHFTAGRSRYSINLAGRGAGAAEDPGTFYFSSGLVGMPRPGGGVEVKSFSYEDSVPPVLHRSPDIKVFAYRGAELRPGFKIPVFNHMPRAEDHHGAYFVNGVDFGINPFSFKIGNGRRFAAVCEDPLDEIPVLLANLDIPVEAVLKTGPVSRKIALRAGERKLVHVPVRRWIHPLNRNYYRFSFSAKQMYPGGLRNIPRVYAAAGFTPLQRAWIYFEAGDFEAAAAHFGGSPDCRTCPVEREILRAYSYWKAGDFRSAARIAGDISYWAEDFFGSGRAECEDSFRDAFLENNGISAAFLEAVNSIRFSGADSSFTGRIKKRAVRGEAPRYSHVVEGPGGIIYGPYVPLPPGSYNVRFVYYADPGAELRFDVSSCFSADSMEYVILPPSGEYGRREALIPFSVEDRTKLIEFRTFLDGEGGVELVYAEVFPDFREDARRKSLMLEAARGAR